MARQERWFVLMACRQVTIYFSCEDCEVEESRIESAGGTVVRPKFSIGDYGFITLAKDTEGNMFGLHSLS